MDHHFRVGISNSLLARMVRTPLQPYDMLTVQEIDTGEEV